MAEKRSILFLQGPPSVFWSELADAFEAEGHRTHRIHVCPADRLFWRRKGAVNYRGRFEDWGTYLADFMRAEGVTDIVYYADQQAYHRVAAEVARGMNINAVAIEFGYLRPDWLTVERNGMGVYSHFPNDPARIRAIAADAPTPDLAVRFPYSFVAEAVAEVTYNLANVFLKPFYPHFNADKYYHPFVDYLSWVPRTVRQRKAQRDAVGVIADCKAGKWPFFMLAMQLQSDYQIRRNSHYGHLSGMLDEVIGSFARNAPSDARLVAKLHPLDNGRENWPRVLRETAARYGLEDRLLTIDGGDVADILPHARGCILVNSTVGLYAIRARCPTKVLGIAVFDIPGLTHQGTLDQFWVAPEPVDAALAEDFVKALAATIQVKGSFYDPAGRKVAQTEIVRRIAQGLVNEPGAFVSPPPRIEKARMAGVPLDA